MAGCKIREQAIVLWAERFCARRWAKGLRLRFFSSLWLVLRERSGCLVVVLVVDRPVEMGGS